MNLDPEPKLTFWSIPPVRQRAQVIAKTITVREARLLLTQFYGMLCFLCGMKVPMILLLVAPALFGTSPSAIDLITSAIPYLILAAVVCGIVVAFVGAGTAWFITGRAMCSRKPDRSHWTCVGATVAAIPALPSVAFVHDSPVPVVAVFVCLLFGAGLGFAFHWIVQRDQVDQTRSP